MSEKHSRKEILRAFGEKVRSERKKQGLSQEELGHKSGLDRSYVGGVERGERNLSLINIIALARALNVAPATFFESVELERGTN